MKKPLILDDSHRSVLSQWVRSRTVSIRWRARARIILAAAKGGTDQAIALELGTTRHRVARWRPRFMEGGVEAWCCAAMRKAKFRRWTEPSRGCR